MDFTHRNFGRLLDTILATGYRTCTVHELVRGAVAGRVAVLRHDVDFDARRATRIAEMEAERSVRATYYFRGRKCRGSHVLPVMRRIASLGHEVGYHYETLDLCRGDVAAATVEFEAELRALRSEGFPVATVCPHGNPRVRKQGYRTNGDLVLRVPELLSRNGVAGDAYASVDFGRIIYISDVGVRFAGKGGAETLRRELEAAPPDRLYMLIHPDYWSAGPARAWALWAAGKLMRAVHVNRVVLGSQAWLHDVRQRASRPG